MKKLVFPLIAAIALLALPICSILGSEQKVKISATVAENIFSRIEGNRLSIETNIPRPITVLISNDSGQFEYTKNGQAFSLPITSEDSITIYEAL